MAKGNQKPKADIIEKVLDAISKERRAAHADFDEVVANIEERVASINDANRGVMQASLDAAADVKAHERFKEHVDAATYDAEHRRLEKADLDAQAAKRAAQKAAEAEMAPLQQRLTAAQEKVKGLATEWQAHLRIAKASGVDDKAYWTPESGVPAKAVP